MNIYTEIKNCRGCRSRDLRSVMNLGNQYIVNFVDDPKTSADSAPINLTVCKNCRLVQLKHSVNPDRLYKQFWYYSGVNTTMKTHLYDLVKQATELCGLTQGDTVIDIGANDGELLGNFPRNIRTIGIEPAKNMITSLKRNCTIALNDYFGETSMSYLKENKIKAKHIYAIAMFYDVENPLQFCENVKQILTKDGIFVIQMNYLKTMLENVAVDNVLSEHLCYYSIQSLEPILSKAKLKIFHSSINDMNGGSVRLYINHEANEKQITFFNYLQNNIMEEKWFGPAAESKLMNRLETFKNQVMTARNKLQTFIKQEREKHKSFYAYGASTRGSALLQTMGLKYPQITLAVERNPIKFGKWMSGLNIQIISEEQMREMPPDYLLILPYFFKDEFVQREEEYLKRGGAMVFPLPKPMVYRWDDKVTLL